MSERAEGLIEELASAATVAVGLAKRLVERGLGCSLEDSLAQEAFAMELSSRSLDFKEGMAALREKRKAEFRGR